MSEAQETPPPRPRRMREIVSANDWQKRLDRLPVDTGVRKKVMAGLELSVADIRDEVVSHVRNSVGNDYHLIRERGGPTAQTLERWTRGEVGRPQIDKLRAALMAVGKDFGVVDAGWRTAKAAAAGGES